MRPIFLALVPAGTGLPLATRSVTPQSHILSRALRRADDALQARTRGRVGAGLASTERSVVGDHARRPPRTSQRTRGIQAESARNDGDAFDPLTERPLDPVATLETVFIEARESIVKLPIGGPCRTRNWSSPVP
jgi:hypothetical protein